MARKHQHEEHVNHEAWAIPYGDLVTLLLAFFVVMYAVSSINEGKYRVMADAMSSAFGGPPRTTTPIQLGQSQLRGSSFDRPSLATAAAKSGPASVTTINQIRVRQVLDMPTFASSMPAPESSESPQSEVRHAARERDRQLSALGLRIQDALTELVRQELVTVRRGRNFLEIEIQSDILFASGAAAPSALATSTVRKLAAVLREAPNAVRVEGYTDDRPIRTEHFPSNWELSAARAAGVVHVMIDEGVDADRLAVVGYGEHQPIADNATDAGRNANRRVLLVILAAPQGPDAVPDVDSAIALQRDAPAPATTPATGQATPAAPAGAPATSVALTTPPTVPATRAGTTAHTTPESAARAAGVPVAAMQLAPLPGHN